MILGRTRKRNPRLTKDGIAPVSLARRVEFLKERYRYLTGRKAVGADGLDREPPPFASSVPPPTSSSSSPMPSSEAMDTI